jgi:hypothetical protein
MNLICEPLESLKQSDFLVGDLYHWELDQNGYFVVEKNSDESSENISDNYFKTLNIDTITQDIQDL